MNFLTRLRGLQAPAALDEPLRLQDGFSGIIVGGGGSGQTLLISRRQYARRQGNRPPGAPVSPGVGLSVSGNTVSLANTTVVAGAYLQANITVDAQGRLTSATTGAATPGVPTTLANLMFWFDASLLVAGAAYPIIQNSAPALAGYNPQNITAGNGLTVVSTLNSLNVATFSGLPEYVLPGPGIFPMANSTVFVVINQPSIPVSNPGIFGSSPTGCYELYINSTGNLEIVVQGAGNIGASTAVLTANTWFQANATYNSSGGPWAFRVARAASGSGSLSHTVNLGSSGVCCASNNAGGAGGALNAQIAEMIVYNRVLTSTEITTIETYLHSKWNV